MHDATMRTTLQIDHDIEPMLRQLVRRRGRSLRVVVNELLRSALLGKQDVKNANEPFEVESAPLGLKRGIDPLKLNQLLDQLEADEFKAESS